MIPYVTIPIILVLFYLVLQNNKRNRKKLKNRKSDFFKRKFDNKRRL